MYCSLVRAPNTVAWENIGTKTKRIAQECFEEASACLSFNVAKLCFSSSAHMLKQTVNAQLSIFVVSSALYKVLKARTGIESSLFAGHSSGEYAAVHAAGSLSFPDALFLLHQRAQLMHAATEQYRGTMLAVLGLSDGQVRAICATFDRPSSFSHVAQVASYNGPKHAVVACSYDLVDQLLDAFRASGGRAVQLPVAGGFHSRFMSDAEQQLQNSFIQVTFRAPHTPLIANQTGSYAAHARALEDELRGQMCRPVLWWASMRHFLSCDIVIQVGPGKTFSNILRRHWPEKRVFSFNDASDLEPIAHVVQAWKEARKEEEIWEEHDRLFR